MLSPLHRLPALALALACCACASNRPFVHTALDFENRCVLDQLSEGQLTLSNQGSGAIEVQARLTRTGAAQLSLLAEGEQLTLQVERGARILLEHRSPGRAQLLLLLEDGGSYRSLLDAY